MGSDWADYGQPILGWALVFLNRARVNVIKKKEKEDHSAYGEVYIIEKRREPHLNKETTYPKNGKYACRSN